MVVEDEHTQTARVSARWAWGIVFTPVKVSITAQRRYLDFDRWMVVPSETFGAEADPVEYQAGFLVQLQPALGLAGSIQVELEAEGTAHVGSDYQSLPASVTLLASEPEEWVRLEVIDHPTPEWTEQVVVDLLDAADHRIAAYQR